MIKKYLFYFVLAAALPSNAQNCTTPGTTAGDTGCATLNYLGSEITYTTVRAKDGNIWLQQNLGSTAVATSQADENAYGHLFQWGRWDDGHQKRTSVIGPGLAANNPSGFTTPTDAYLSGWWSTNSLTDSWTAETPASVSESNGCDPCKTLGEHWKIPSETEWEALVEAEAIVNPATAFQSNLKLPASGYRSTSGALTFVDTRGYFWSTTPSSTGAKYLYVGTTLANPSAGGSRAQGASIRCMRLAETLGNPDWNLTAFAAYPNPTSGSVSITAGLEIETIAVYNALGQKIQTSHSATIDLSDEKSGIYVLIVTFANGQSATKKIVKT